jgi:hypothetical protein
MLGWLWAYLHRLTCWHTTRKAAEGPWRRDPDVGDHRHITVRCLDCGAILRDVIEHRGQPWR